MALKANTEHALHRCKYLHTYFILNSPVNNFGLSKQPY